MRTAGIWNIDSFQYFQAVSHMPIGQKGFAKYLSVLLVSQHTMFTQRVSLFCKQRTLLPEWNIPLLKLLSRGE
jgi:hypothetical protein